MTSSTSILLEPPRPRPGIARWFRRALQDSFLRKGSLAIFDQAIVSGTSFATSVILGRACGKEELGAYFLALSLVMFARGIQEQLVSAPYMIYCNRRAGRDLAAYAGSTLAHQWAITLIALAALGGLLVGLGMGHGPAELLPTAWALVGAIPFLLLREYVRCYAFAHFRAATAIVVDAGVAALQLGGLLALGLCGWLSAPTAYLVMGGACAAAAAAWWRIRGGEFRFERPRFLADWKHNWAFGKWAVASQLVGCSAPYLMPWVLACAHGSAETGVLAACSSLVGLSNMFVMGLSHYLSPKAAHSYVEGGVPALRRVMWKTAAIFTATLGAFSLVCLAAGDWIIVLVYGDKYAGTGAGLVITVLALGMWANSLAITAGNGLWAMERPQANFRADVASLVVTAIAAFALVPAFEVLGIALASLVGGIAGAIVRGETLRELMRRVERERPAAAGGAA